MKRSIFHILGLLFFLVPWPRDAYAAEEVETQPKTIAPVPPQADPVQAETQDKNAASAGHQQETQNEKDLKLIKKLSFLEFRLFSFTVFQTGGSSSSGLISWNPQYRFEDHLGLRAHLGLSLLNQTGVAALFPVLDYAFLFSYDFDADWNLEAGVGAQSWYISPSAIHSAALSANLAFKLPESFFDRIIVGYSAAFFSMGTAHEIRAGVGLSF